MRDIRGVWPIIDKLKNCETWRTLFYRGVSGLRRVKINYRGVVLLAAIVVGVMFATSLFKPYKNNPVRLKKINYAKVFNDVNSVHLKAAKSLGLEKPLKGRDEAEDVMDDLVRIEDNRYYSIARLTHSIPYLTEGAAELLEVIGKNFRDSLKQKGINPNKIIVTSVLRTQADIKSLQKSGNINASSNSAHCYATTFDIAYADYEKVEYKRLRRCESIEPGVLKQVLGEVLMALQQKEMCYVKYEKKQRCFHITTRI